MDKQQEFVLRTLEERDIRFVRLWFTDVLGFLKSVAVAPAELEQAFDEGIGFDGSAIEGFARVYESDMIAKPENNLAGFELVESSEAGMLTEAEQAIRDKRWIVFLGWTPHPVMGEMPIAYLDGMGSTGFGAATVHTNVRKGYLTECPNAGAFVKNLKFTLSSENEMMDAILKGGNPDSVAKDWLRKNPDAVTPWLQGVTTFEGGDAAAAVKKALEG